ncbi:UDP-GalNAc:beta-1,3-N-acetylgalactosaminyltransferase 1 [Aplysia californica]|uniref:Hexosyltransferase n=1 Tax=Aplysia californica TaxID=6500 RepID=A0ABM0K9K4_APLCA|nr:UDP-GalNAc:beta-1,3-N-acetylgalactosaminyltransferase 1 [Aplysia californica]
MLGFLKYIRSCALTRNWTLCVLLVVMVSVGCLSVVKWSILYLQQIPQLPEGDNPHDYKYILKPGSNSCNGLFSPELVICVSSSVANFEERATLRDTWASVVKDQVHYATLFFFMGRPSRNETALQAALRREQAQYDDIVQEDFMDTYNNLSLKTVSILKWASYNCPNSKFVVKADDDVYVTIPNMLKALREASMFHEEFVLGVINFFAIAGHPERSGKDAVTMEYPYMMYPLYIIGPTYAMPISSAKLLYRASLRMPHHRAEDVYVTGFLAREAGVSLVNDDRFSGHRWPIDGCVFRSKVSGHGYSSKEQRAIHAKMLDSSILCTESVSLAHTMGSTLFVWLTVFMILALWLGLSRCTSVK